MTVPSAPTNDVALGTVLAHPPSLDRILLCGSGNFGTLAHVFRDVQTVESVVAEDDQIRLLAPTGRNILARLIELAEACDVDVTLAVVLHNGADAR